jgi:parallel beta-helix repeat protein
MALALGMTIFASEAGAQPVPISECMDITASGSSYVLVRNLFSTDTCIHVMADSVTIDLAGFWINGGGNQNSGSGILSVAPDGSGTVVRNGTIVDFGWGVQLLSSDVVVEKLRVFGNRDSGIVIFRGTVRDNVVADNGRYGIALQQGEQGIVTGNYASGNGYIRGSGGAGIFAGGIVSGNMVLGPPVGGSDGIVASAGSTVIGNTVQRADIGIRAQCPSNLINNTATVISRVAFLLSGPNTCNAVNNVPPAD